MSALTTGLQFAVIGFCQNGHGDELAIDLCQKLISFLIAWGVPTDATEVDNGFATPNQVSKHASF